MADVDDENAREDRSKMYTELIGVSEDEQVVACSSLTFRNAAALKFVPDIVNVVDAVVATFGERMRGENDSMALDRE